MNYIGWVIKFIFERYFRILKIVDRGVIGIVLVGVVFWEEDVERKFLKFGDDLNLKLFLQRLG